MFGLVDRRAAVHPVIQSDGTDLAWRSREVLTYPEKLTRDALFGSAPIVTHRRSSRIKERNIQNLDQFLPGKWRATS
jgi:hypothetical protein